MWVIGRCHSYSYSYNRLISHPRCLSCYRHARHQLPLPVASYPLRLARSFTTRRPPVDSDSTTAKPSPPTGGPTDRQKTTAVSHARPESASKSYAVHFAHPPTKNPYRPLHLVDIEFAPEAEGSPTRQKREFDAAIATAQPDLIMHAMLSSGNERNVGNLSQSAFIEAFRLLSPAHFIEPYWDIHRPLHGHLVWVKQYKQLMSIFNDFVKNICTIVQIRQSAGRTLGLAEYTHLLACARSVGDALFADYVWGAMQNDHVVPDLQCYNYYMEAKVWDGAYKNKEKFRLLVTPFDYRKRRFGRVGWTGYGTGPRSVRAAVNSLYNDMKDHGYAGDEATMINRILAAARVGKTFEMAEILKEIWNVDLETLKAGGHQYPVTDYPRSSPLYPSSRLLVAIAHGFGTNCDVPAAIKLIEHFHKTYNIPVIQEVWDQLFELSFALSHRINRRNRGALSRKFFRNLADAMTREPHNAQLSSTLHFKIAKSTIHEWSITLWLHHMRVIYKILEQTRKKATAARKIVETYLRYPRVVPGGRIDPRVMTSRGFAESIHAYDILRHKVMQEEIFLEGLAQKLITVHVWLDNRDDWELVWLPRAIEEWRDFLPQTLDTHIRGNRIIFIGRTKWGQRKITPHPGAPVRRPSHNDDFKLDPSAFQIEDPIVWDRYYHRLDHHDRRHTLIKRLFEPANVPRVSYDADFNSTPEHEPTLDSNDGHSPLENQEPGQELNPQDKPYKPTIERIYDPYDLPAVNPKKDPKNDIYDPNYDPVIASANGWDDVLMNPKLPHGHAEFEEEARFTKSFSYKDMASLAKKAAQIASKNMKEMNTEPSVEWGYAFTDIEIGEGNIENDAQFEKNFLKYSALAERDKLPRRRTDITDQEEKDRILRQTFDPFNEPGS
ncbi:mitochondrial ATPase expression-domain-containing protein [Aspergillus karnatakaensis]|uniref:uncharacterized protein n=1 Tax=Aspergillus karnatakaensis TaxID=1810916 RepID=UPI003CCD0E2D